MSPLPEPLTASLLVAMFGALLVAGSLHELTHYATARLLGCAARVKLHSDHIPRRKVWFWDPHVEYEVRAERGTWVERVVGLSPQLIGFVGGAIYVSTAGMPTGPFAPAIGLGWAIYTLYGGIEDYSVGAAHGGGIRDQPAAARKLGWAALLFSAGLAMSYFTHDIAGLLGTSERSYRTFVFLIGQGSVSILLISLLCIGLAARTTDSIPEDHVLRTPVADWRP